MFIHERLRAISSLLLILFSMYLRALASIVYGITDDCLRKSKFIVSTQTFTRLFPLYFPRASKMTDHFVYTHIFICCFLLSWKAKKNVLFCFEKRISTIAETCVETLCILTYREVYNLWFMTNLGPSAIHSREFEDRTFKSSLFHLLLFWVTGFSNITFRQPLFPTNLRLAIPFCFKEK